MLDGIDDALGWFFSLAAMKFAWTGVEGCFDTRVYRSWCLSFFVFEAGDLYDIMITSF